MKAIATCSLLLVLLALTSNTWAADCDEAKNPDDSDFKHFFKNIGCKVKQGAEDVAEAAKPYADKIGEGAKDFGNTVAQKYDQLKHRLTDDAPSSTTSTASSGAAPVPVAPTERVPLAPIGGPQSSPILNADSKPARR
ncbi:uncharacterized protein LOC115628061 [Scaptodrosophila lebanonensis]|uniref:Uncharacterized protein LOC115628061 n=1 Tax=Drosophila lebanonensis TaxID=7225 RepID=A0A6J2TTH5_DROLE|nr:uncharacterized protein LOC115628061 [Scaptodrosophila lebanonensis]